MKMMVTKSLIMSITWVIASLLMLHQVEGANHFYPSPPAFEKIYICPNRIFYTPQGKFYLYPGGKKEKIQNLLSDKKGVYFLKVFYQCPMCGRCTTNKTPQQGFDCPLWKIQVMPHIWCDH
jgi:hypothetical protein